MIHVPDVRATVAWYSGIGFKVLDTYTDDGDGLSFAILSFGDSEVMFNEGGDSSTKRRREVDLYVYTDNLDDLYRELKDRVDVVEGPHDTFYGMREVIIRDLNRFWITFGQESAYAALMRAVREGQAEAVRGSLEHGNFTPEQLTAAVAVSTGAAEIVEMLKQAGAIAPPEVGAEKLQSYAGNYKSEQGSEVIITFRNGRLFAAPGGQQPMRLLAIDQITFRPISFDDMTITFTVEAGQTTGFEFRHGARMMAHKRVAEAN